METFFGIISAMVIFISGFFYTLRVYQHKITPNLISWGIWALIGISIFLNYKAIGAKENLFAAFAGTLCPILTFILAFFRKHEKEFDKTNIFCGIVGVCSLVLWYYLKFDPYYAQYSLYLALLPDVIALIPSFRGVIRNPLIDRPGGWFLFSVGSAINILAVSEHTFQQYIYPVLMSFTPALVWIPLIKYRIKNKISIKQWI